MIENRFKHIFSKKITSLSNRLKLTSFIKNTIIEMRHTCLYHFITKYSLLQFCLPFIISVILFTVLSPSQAACEMSYSEFMSSTKSQQEAEVFITMSPERIPDRKMLFLAGFPVENYYFNRNPFNDYALYGPSILPWPTYIGNSVNPELAIPMNMTIDDFKEYLHTNHILYSTDLILSKESNNNDRFLKRMLHYAMITVDNNIWCTTDVEITAEDSSINRYLEDFYNSAVKYGPLFPDRYTQALCYYNAAVTTFNVCYFYPVKHFDLTQQIYYNSLQRIWEQMNAIANMEADTPDVDVQSSSPVSQGDIMDFLEEQLQHSETSTLRSSVQEHSNNSADAQL